MSQSVGEQLKQARQDRKITLAQAADATRVKLHYLEALENNDLATLPSKVQGKGFLRIYVEYLGLPLQPLLDAWEGKTPAVSAQPVPPSIGTRPTPGCQRTLLTATAGRKGTHFPTATATFTGCPYSQSIPGYL